MFRLVIRWNSFPSTLAVKALIVPVRHKTATKTLFEMNTAYFRHVEGEDNFHVTFRFVNKELGIDKQLNFCRRISENCAAFLSRVDANVEKLVEKKNKKAKTKKKPEEAVNVIAKPPQSTLLCDGSPVNSEWPCSQIFTQNAAYVLEVVNCLLPVEINPPWVEAIALPKSIMAGFLVYPCKFETFYADEDESSWTWHRGAANDGPWLECGAGPMYETSCADIGHFVKVVCVPRDASGRSGPPFAAISPAAVEAGPGTLPCEERHTFTTHKTDDSQLRIVSYNILADLYVDSHYSRNILFGYCATYALELAYRKQLLLKELLGYNADVLCLQEVDSKVFRHDLEPILRKKGFSGEFNQKGETGEGTAVFYDQRKLRGVENWRVVLGEALKTEPLFAEIWETIRHNEAFVTRVTERSTTLQVLLLESLTQPGEMMLLANIHLYFHPDADHVRLFQAVLSTIYLELKRNEVQKQYPDKKISLVWCGDFNSVPECGIYKLLTTGSVMDDHIDWRSNVSEAVCGVNYSHKLSMGSAYPDPLPPFTNYTVGFKACLDYIYYDTDGFDVEQVVPLPSEEILAQHLAIPSVVFPSDHVALIADLRWKKLNK